MIGLERPAHFVVPARLVRHIGLDINSVDSFAFIEEISRGIALVIEPFGITEFALLASF